MSLCKLMMRSVLKSLRASTLCRLDHTPSRGVASIIDGKKIAEDIKMEIKAEIDQLTSGGQRQPHLSVVLVGDDPASAVYVRNKINACKRVGINSEAIVKPSATSETELLDTISALNENPGVDGILVQLPVPEHMNERVICNAIHPSKDVDGFHVVNVGRFVQDMDCLMPCTPLGVQQLIIRSGVETFGKNAVVCGRSKNVGMPIAMLLHADGEGDTNAFDATTTLCHRYTPPEQLRRFVQTADIVVTAAGVVNLITADMVKPGCCVIDVGINRIVGPNGKPQIVGDVDFEGVRQVAGHITPVPGGVGPMTVAMLMKNTLRAYKKEVNEF
ncbi:bifunctional methylenetetrahydrofolate dehydrogenase/cyclohydrolase, mitochondrial-like isoform X1 [Amphibalanus amphitrite]|uniref:bifunctional methylenetetrahydrofolate dehydrogenase/cyclohydrolase, mitochondrial-like isoform X1 n=1 Tax=Amphibalanus amphitrite TaxID=1232801 RepID=UPI001C907BFA|nr:bifunctional methylenetetrahydrofolate dehydrogenase/cyclohydrolase, mitochondrial-like isoform X1 [Amphibalanus amphitrite]XP_043209056.1 bifunctional methylenetetrahydrofolate dehydrogenase/cyclohydrolase, mitochondrial-like isoform X1 [Amphibalanus amphitrite]XP_043209057.1 bifunctional methylenetetrahydrofolate dehydrogenase/cyclohydrolase, mitochondrial-like isoform X1 [Amphibalanus amphitrite]